MLKRKWVSKVLNTWADWKIYRDGIKMLNPEVAAFDTESTGLHIIHDRPFIFQFGFLHPSDESKGFTFLTDLRSNPASKDIINSWHEVAAKCGVYLGHNVKFDIHMLKNIGIEYDVENLSDTQYYIRYATDAILPREGGAPLPLKDFAARFIDPSAKYHEQLLRSERTGIAKTYNLKLKERLVKANIIPPMSFKKSAYTLGIINELFKDPIFDKTDLDDATREVYEQWFKEDLPEYLQKKVTAVVESDMIRYSELNTQNLYKYAHLDIVYPLEIYDRLQPILKHRGNQRAIEIENSNIFPNIDMERQGLLMDREYLEASRIRMKEYIIERRKDLLRLAGEEVKIGQHRTIKLILKDRYGIPLTSVGSEALENTQIDNPRAKEFVDVIQELRSLEKWYSTYIIKFQKELQDSDRAYTTIHQVGTVSGRISSDFQQFPKGAILDKDGQELFHPRKLVLCPPECEHMLFLDYAAEEMRVTAMYTILVGDPDVNLLRAYTPYKCVERDGKYYLEEDPETEWHPVDVHAATAVAAGYSRDDPDFKHYRSIGKRTNFAKNYGASYYRIRQMFPDKTPEECRRIDQAYYKAFPGIKTYHSYCFERANRYPYTSNLFEVRYYNVSGHKLRNILVQGSCAHFLKIKNREIWDYLRKNNLKSRAFLQAHDEMMFAIVKGEAHIRKDLIAIMEDWPGALVPIVVESEVSTTNWAEKEEIE